LLRDVRLRLSRDFSVRIPTWKFRVDRFRAVSAAFARVFLREPTKLDQFGVEIEAAVRAVRARGLDIADIRRGDFPLPTLGRVLDRLRAEVLDGGRARSASSFCARG
jgi:hypothetical protein